MRIIKILLVVLLSVSMAHAEDADLRSPDDIIQQVVARILTTFHEDKAILHDHTRMEQFVEDAVLPRFDFIYMSQLTVGESAWQTASAENQSNFSDEYRIFLAHMFSNSLSLYNNETVTFIAFEMPPDANKALVRGKLLDPGNESTEMVFKLVKVADGWKIYDIDMGGVDLIKTYRSNFKSTLQAGGIESLVKALHTKNQASKAIRNE